MTYTDDCASPVFVDYGADDFTILMLTPTGTWTWLASPQQRPLAREQAIHAKPSRCNTEHYRRHYDKMFTGHRFRIGGNKT